MKLISTSNINFETYKVLELNMFSVAGFVLFSPFPLVPVFYLFKSISKLQESQYRYEIILSVIISIVVPAFFSITNRQHLSLWQFFILFLL